MAMTLSQLQSQLSGLDGYTPESEDVLRQRAQAVYDPQYEQDLALLRDNLQQSVNATERGAIRTGMQRSSYNNASLVGLVGAGQKAQAQLAAQREGNIANLLLQLINGEKDRKAQADAQRNSLLLNLYQLGQQGNGGNGYGYGYGSNSSAQTADAATPTGNTNPLTALVNAIGGYVGNVTQNAANTLNKKVNTKKSTAVNYYDAIRSGGSAGNALQQEGRLAY